MKFDKSIVLLVFCHVVKHDQGRTALVTIPLLNPSPTFAFPEVSSLQRGDRNKCDRQRVLICPMRHVNVYKSEA